MYKIKSRSQFLKVYKKGGYFKGEGIHLYILKNGLPYNRVGISISRDSVSLAVKRNRCRRLLLESYRLYEHMLKTGYDLVFTLRRDLSSLKLNNIKEMTTKLYRAARILR